MSNGVPSIVFRGISDTVGGGGTLLSSIFSLAATNVVRDVVVEFIGLLGREGKVHDQWALIATCMVELRFSFPGKCTILELFFFYFLGIRVN